MNETRKRLKEHAKSVADQVEDADDIVDDLDVLDVVVEYSMGSNTVQEITLTLTTGGPHVELALNSERIDVYHGSRTYKHSMDGLFGDDVSAIEHAREYYTRQFEENFLA